MTIHVKEEGLLEWRVLLGDQMPQKRVPVIVAILIAGVVGFFMVRWWGFFIGIGIVFASTAELWVPIQYKITEHEASSRCGLSVTAIRWENVKRLIHTSEGVRLSPLEKSSRLDEFRGVYLRFSGNRDEVLAKIAELTERHGSSLDGEVNS